MMVAAAHKVSPIPWPAVGICICTQTFFRENFTAYNSQVNSSVIFENDGCVHSDNWLILAIHSLQPKTVIAFQWVKLDDVKLAHERLAG
jgi:hypothetical protein